VKGITGGNILEYLADTANIDEITDLVRFFPLDGVTTNPTILAAEKRPISQIVPQILEIIGSERMFHFQTISSTAEKMTEEAVFYQKKFNVSKDFYYAKIPITADGLQTIRDLKRIGIQTTATAIFTPQQAILAAKAGASYVAPYVNRLDNIVSQGIQVVGDIVKMFKDYNLKTKVLAASFKNADQLYRVCLAEAHSVTVNYELLKTIIQHPMTDIAIHDFILHAEGIYDLKP
jgi:fructose-6-phosphate aldolase 2